MGTAALARKGGGARRPTGVRLRPARGLNKYAKRVNKLVGTLQPSRGRGLARRPTGVWSAQARFDPHHIGV